MAGRCVRSILTVWNISTTPSYRILSNTILSVINTPVRPTPALKNHKQNTFHLQVRSEVKDKRIVAELNQGVGEWVVGVRTGLGPLSSVAPSVCAPPPPHTHLPPEKKIIKGKKSNLKEKESSSGP